MKLTGQENVCLKDLGHNLRTPEGAVWVSLLPLGERGNDRCGPRPQVVELRMLRSQQAGSCNTAHGRESNASSSARRGGQR